MSKKDWNADGSYIAADNAQEAKAEFRHLYGSEPSEVRPWTDEDQERLDFDTKDDHRR